MWKPAFRAGLQDQFTAKGRWFPRHALTVQKVRMGYEVTPSQNPMLQIDRLAPQSEHRPFYPGATA